MRCPTTQATRSAAKQPRKMSKRPRELCEKPGALSSAPPLLELLVGVGAAGRVEEEAVAACARGLKRV